MLDRRYTMAEWQKVRIDEDAHPKSYHVKVGDLVQCYMSFALSPPSIVRDIAVFLETEVMRKIGVVHTPGSMAIGVGQISAFFFVQNEGLCTVHLVPVVVGEMASEHSLTFLASRAES
jgi:hypothetical protein